MKPPSFERGAKAFRAGVPVTDNPCPDDLDRVSWLTGYATALDDWTTIVNLVAAANPGRKPDNLARRTIKLLEEIGELAEAYLQVSSPTNHKGKSKDDCLEETVDVLIVTIDLALTLKSIDPVAQRLNQESDDWEYSLFGLTEAAAQFGYRSTGHHALMMTQYAFALLHKYDTDEIIKVMKIKLAKWADNRATGKVATDAE